MKKITSLFIIALIAMQITNIKGKYIPASGDILASIEIADTDIDNITIKNTSKPN